MTDPVRPAAVWRRCAAAVYDGLLLVALWMITALLDVVMRDLAGLSRNLQALQVLEFSVGLLFFGWFWTHGGQTLGMRVWKLRVRRHDGGELRWPVAAVRYSVMLATWIATFLPLLLLSPKVAAHVHAGPAASIATIVCALAVVALLVDRRRRTLCDWASGTEVIESPKEAQRQA